MTLKMQISNQRLYVHVIYVRNFLLKQSQVVGGVILQTAVN